MRLGNRTFGSKGVVSLAGSDDRPFLPELAAVGLCAVLAALPSCWALAQAAIQHGFGGKAPYDVSAEDAQTFEADHRVVLRGNAEVAQGGRRIRAPVITMTYKEEGDPKKSARRVAEKIEAEGPVYILGPEQAIKGDHAVYAASQSMITVTGHVILTRGRDVATCDRLQYNQATGRISLSMETPGRRVRTVLFPSDSPPSNPK